MRSCELWISNDTLSHLPSTMGKTNNAKKKARQKAKKISNDSGSSITNSQQEVASSHLQEPHEAGVVDSESTVMLGTAEESLEYAPETNSDQAVNSGESVATSNSLGDSLEDVEPKRSEFTATTANTDDAPTYSDSKNENNAANIEEDKQPFVDLTQSTVKVEPEDPVQPNADTNDSPSDADNIYHKPTESVQLSPDTRDTDDEFYNSIAANNSAYERRPSVHEPGSLDLPANGQEDLTTQTEDNVEQNPTATQQPLAADEANDFDDFYAELAGKEGPEAPEIDHPASYIQSEQEVNSASAGFNDQGLDISETLEQHETPHPTHSVQSGPSHVPTNDDADDDDFYKSLQGPSIEENEAFQDEAGEDFYASIDSKPPPGQSQQPQDYSEPVNESDIGSNRPTATLALELDDDFLDDNDSAMPASSTDHSASEKARLSFLAMDDDLLPEDAPIDEDQTRTDVVDVNSTSEDKSEKPKAPKPVEGRFHEFHTDVTGFDLPVEMIPRKVPHRSASTIVGVPQALHHMPPQAPPPTSFTPQPNMESQLQQMRENQVKPIPPPPRTVKSHRTASASPFSSRYTPHEQPKPVSQPPSSSILSGPSSGIPSSRESVVPPPRPPPQVRRASSIARQNNPDPYGFPGMQNQPPPTKPLRRTTTAPPHAGAMADAQNHQEPPPREFLDSPLPQSIASPDYTPVGSSVKEQPTPEFPTEFIAPPRSRQPGPPPPRAAAPRASRSRLVSHPPASHSAYAPTSSSTDIAGLAKPEQPPTSNQMAPGVDKPVGSNDIDQLTGHVDISASRDINSPPVAQYPPTGVMNQRRPSHRARPGRASPYTPSPMVQHDSTPGTIYGQRPQTSSPAVPPVVSSSDHRNPHDELLRRQRPILTWSSKSVASLIPAAIAFGAPTSSIKVTPLNQLGQLLDPLFPGPLVGSKGPVKGKQKDVEKWLLENQSRRLFFAVLLALIQHKSDKEIASILTPEASDAQLMPPLPSGVDFSGRKNHERTSSTSLAQTAKLAITGDLDGALECALRNGDWAHALILSQAAGQWTETVAMFSREILRPESPSMSFLYRVMAGDKEAISELRPRGTTELVDRGLQQKYIQDWALFAAPVVANRQRFPESSTKALLDLGKLLVEHGLTEEGHICMLLSNNIPFGDPHGIFLPLANASLGRDHDSLVAAEILEWYLVTEHKKTPYGHLIPFKIAHAGLLSDVGMFAESSRLAESSLAQARSIKVMPLVILAEKALARCNQPSNETSTWLTRKLSRPNLEKAVVSSFNKFVAGDNDEPRAPTRPASAGPGPIMPPPLAPPPSHRYTPGPYPASGGQVTPAESEPTPQVSPFGRSHYLPSPHIPQQFGQTSVSSSPSSVYPNAPYGYNPPYAVPGPVSQPQVQPSAIDEEPEYVNGLDQPQSETYRNPGIPKVSSRTSMRHSESEIVPSWPLSRKPETEPIPNLYGQPQAPGYVYDMAPEPIPSPSPAPAPQVVNPSFNPTPSDTVDDVADTADTADAVDDDLGIGNQKHKKPEEDSKPKSDSEQPSHKKKSGWFSWLRKGNNDDEPKAIKAKLGEENHFYYDEKLGRWVNKDAPAPEEEKPPPPPPPAMPKSASAAPSPRPPSTQPVGHAPPIGGGPPPPVPGGSSRPRVASSRMPANDIDSLLGNGTSTIPRRKRGPRNRYIDVVQQQQEG